MIEYCAGLLYQVYWIQNNDFILQLSRSEILKLWMQRQISFCNVTKCRGQHMIGCCCVRKLQVEVKLAKWTPLRKRQTFYAQIKSTQFVALSSWVKHNLMISDKNTRGNCNPIYIIVLLISLRPLNHPDDRKPRLQA